MDEPALRQMSTEILTESKEWRRANPRATYVQIENEVHKRLMQLETRLIFVSSMRQSQQHNCADFASVILKCTTRTFPH
jgi:hypothetical protein